MVEFTHEIPFDINQVSIYIVNFKDDDRKEKMTNRFNTLGYTNFIFTPPVFNDDIRFENKETPPLADRRVWSVMLQHLDSIRDFYDNTENKYCIVCEDDIHISKNMFIDLPNIIQKFNEFELDVFLLGYLNIYDLDNNYYINKIYSKTDEFPYSIYQYPDHQWGSQMYLISRNHAKYLLETYTIEYAIVNMNNPPFSPDWIFTKVGKRALLGPMIAVEEGTTKTYDYGQNVFHIQSHQLNYNPEIYI
jgi:hypothetical protein